MSNRVVVKLCDQCEEHWVPRAVVAISEDRQWLVVLNPAGYSGWFVRYRLNAYGYWVPDVQAGEPCCIKDTGQDAHEVLAAFLREREE